MFKKVQQKSVKTAEQGFNLLFHILYNLNSRNDDLFYIVQSLFTNHYNGELNSQFN